MFEKPDVIIQETAADDPRIGQLINKKNPDKKIHLAGFCSDQGVAVNNGRTGAASAPDVIRRALWKMTPDPTIPKTFSELVSRVKDHGNFPANAHDLAAAQQKLGDWVSEVLLSGGFPLVLGGGHETAYGHFLGYVKSERPVTILNWDAHADVRGLKDGKPHSGSPFRQALEDHPEICRHYVVGGLQRQSLSAAHLKFIQERKGHYYFCGELSKRIINNMYDRLSGPAMVTMDMDALDHTIAPGVSAPAVNGMSLALWLHAAWNAGKNKNVQSLDIVELNPEFDRDNQTARVAALTIWYFWKGFIQREKKG